MYSSTCTAAGCAEAERDRDELILNEPVVPPIDDYSGSDIVKATLYGAIS